MFYLFNDYSEYRLLLGNTFRDWFFSTNTFLYVVILAALIFIFVLIIIKTSVNAA